MKIDVAHAGVLFLRDLVDVTGASRHAQLKFNGGKFFLKAGLEFLPEFSARRDRDHHFPLALGGLHRFFPFRLSTGFDSLANGGSRSHQCDRAPKSDSHECFLKFHEVLCYDHWSVTPKVCAPKRSRLLSRY